MPLIIGLWLKDSTGAAISQLLVLAADRVFSGY
jgi:hypothetical protein